MEIKRFLKDRKKAFEGAVLDDDWDGVKRYLIKYGMPIPDDERILKAGVYKAVQECTDLSDKVKETAKEKCIAMGFSPYAYKRIVDLRSKK